MQVIEGTGGSRDENAVARFHVPILMGRESRTRGYFEVFTRFIFAFALPLSERRRAKLAMRS